MIKERQLEFKHKIIQDLDPKTKFCLDWRIYKSILYHILSNAIKFCNSKGQVGLEIKYNDLDSNDYPQQKGIKFGVLTTEVLNTGEGMSKSQLKKLGQSFLRDGSNSAKHGVGIGLVTAKDLCQSLDGDLKIISSKDKGTVVTFTVIVTDSEYKKLMNRGDNKAIRKSLSTKKPIDLSASCFMMEINSDCSMSSDGKKNKDNKLKPSKHS